MHREVHLPDQEYQGYDEATGTGQVLCDGGRALRVSSDSIDGPCCGAAVCYQLRWLCHAKTAPFGLHGLPSYFQQVMSEIVFKDIETFGVEWTIT